MGILLATTFDSRQGKQRGETRMRILVAQTMPDLNSCIAEAMTTKTDRSVEKALSP